MKDAGAPVSVALFYCDACPSYELVLADLRDIIEDLGLGIRVDLVRVATQRQADMLRFAGSPTVKVNGRDLEGVEGPGVLACRLYGEGQENRPSYESLRRALLAAYQPKGAERA